MTKINCLPINRLKASLPLEAVPFATSEHIDSGPACLSVLQPRALAALSLALRIKGLEYNVYLAGDSDLGRTHFAKGFLTPLAQDAPTPPDWLYLHNFDDPDQPIAISLPAGQGRGFKSSLNKAMTKVREEIPLRFEQEAYVTRKQSLMRAFQSERDELFSQMEDEAQKDGFNLEIDDQGALTLYPLLEGKVVSNEEFERLEPDLRKRLRARGEKIMDDMGGYLRRISQQERGLKDQEKKLDRETVAEVLEAYLAPAAGEFSGHERLKEYFAALSEDILDNIESFLPQAAPTPGPHVGELGASPYPIDSTYRYEVNLLVDNSRLSGAPVIIEDHPTYFNLMGCIERESEMGALYTDFSLIKAGSLHKANGGFLIIKIEDLLQSQATWEGLIRALRSGEARIEDPADIAEHTRTRTIEPEPVKLDLKVILVGSDETFEMLLYSDDRFHKIFKIKAHLQDALPRNPENIRLYLTLLGPIIEAAGLLPFDREALAGMVEFASYLAEDQQKLSLRMPLARELMIEASATAQAEAKTLVDAASLKSARSARAFRANLLEEEFLREYDREMLKVATDGREIGRANGLSVRLFGDYSFGLPHQIACTVGVGHGGILDLEREAELGGPIHTKGMMILKSYLIGQFAQDKPLVLTGSLCFEQSYAEVEGDSASGAELAALLSALAERPIDLSYAFTGAVSQSGAILAVGGVNQKIEGFFEVCSRRGLTGRQGVLIPADNVVNLMLKDEVIEAVCSGKFSIFPIKSIAEAMEILTGLPAGAREQSGGFEPGSLYHLVDERLLALVKSAAKWGELGRGCGSLG